MRAPGSVSGPRFDRLTLSRARTDGLKRLAHFLGEPVGRSRRELVESLVRKLDEDDSWPPRVTERTW